MFRSCLAAAVPVILFASAISQAPSVSAADGPAILGTTEECSTAGATVSFSWASSGNGSQWLDLSLSSSFAEGTFVSAGALNPAETVLNWAGLESGRTHFWRVATLSPDGWVNSTISSFTPCIGVAPDAYTLEGQLLQAHNADRAAYGLLPLYWDEELAQIARARAYDMAVKGYFSHTSPSGESAATLIYRSGIFFYAAAENLARNNLPDAQSAQAAETGFMESASHRINVLDPQFNRAGVAVSNVGGIKYFVVVYAAR